MRKYELCAELSVFLYYCRHVFRDPFFCAGWKKGKKLKPSGHCCDYGNVRDGFRVLYENRWELYVYDGAFSCALGKWDPCRGFGRADSSDVWPGYVFCRNRRYGSHSSGCGGKQAEFILYYDWSDAQLPFGSDLYQWLVYGLCICGDQYHCRMRPDYDPAGGAQPVICHPVYDHEPAWLRIVFDRVKPFVWCDGTSSDESG